MNQLSDSVALNDRSLYHRLEIPTDGRKHSQTPPPLRSGEFDRSKLAERPAAARITRKIAIIPNYAAAALLTTRTL